MFALAEQRHFVVVVLARGCLILVVGVVGGGVFALAGVIRGINSFRWCDPLLFDHHLKAFD